MASDAKKRAVEALRQLIKAYPIVGVANLQNLPAPQLQGLRRSLRGKVELRMARRRLLKLALEQEGGGVERLVDHLSGMPALLFTKENPFQLYKITQKNKSSAPAKAGQIAPNDILIPAGPTPFAPGPVIGELGAIGLKTGVEGGKVVIKADSVVCRKGEAVTPKAADVLKRLGIQPMEIGLHIVAVLEGGMVFLAEQLAIDESRFMAELLGSVQEARNLAVEAAYPAHDVTELLIQKAFREAKAVALEAGVVDKELIEELLGKVGAEARALQGAAHA